MNEISVKDMLYKKAKVIVLQDNNCSISYLQRTLEIGYNRASIIVGFLEAEGVISTPNKKAIRTIINKQ